MVVLEQSQEKLGMKLDSLPSSIFPHIFKNASL